MIKYPDLEKAISALPPVARKELLDFIGYLQYKHGAGQARDVVQLGGLWSDIEFDVTDEDVRALRQLMTRQSVDKV